MSRPMDLLPARDDQDDDAVLVERCGDCPMVGGDECCNWCGMLNEYELEEGTHYVTPHDDAPPPSWCPLRAGDVVVRLAESP
jgi:hypothetical protein